MTTIGDNGDSFGLFQVRRPYHCRGALVCGLFRHDAALNADYWASIVRTYYDGKQTWLNTVSGNGARYSAGDLWGSIGAWFSGRWHDPGAESYVTKVKDYLHRRVCRTRPRSSSTRGVRQLPASRTDRVTTPSAYPASRSTDAGSAA